ncbi:MAG TPA: (2Fe-2S)-binding protein [Thermoanaerobaculia bacterium]|nr:(2Fe-2S)-binding protein [Thermoanaerobaculia bacterium]
MIVCLCRGASHSVIDRAIDDGARSLRDLQRCGIGDQCGSCHNVLRKMLAAAAAEREAAMVAAACCPVHAPAVVPSPA